MTRDTVPSGPIRVPQLLTTAFARVLSDTPPSPLDSGSISRPRPQLSLRKRQHRDPPHHSRKELPRQMSFRQKKPLVASMFYQPSARLHQPMLQTRQRPVLDSLGQRQPPPQIPQVVGQQAQR